MGKLKITNQVIDKTIIKNTLIELGEVSIIYKPIFNLDGSTISILTGSVNLSN